MLSEYEYKALKCLERTNPEIYQIIDNENNDILSNLSIASHEIKNYAAIIKTSCQLLSKNHTELSEDKNFKRISSNIDNLLFYLDRTSDYRYSQKVHDLTIFNLCELLLGIPDYFDNIIDERRYTLYSKLPDITNFEFDIPDTPLNIHTNPIMLNRLLFEAILNAAEASLDHSILIFAKTIKKHNDNTDCYENTANIRVSYASDYWEIDLDKISQPFYTEKEKHIGLGLSIIHQICLTYNYKYSLKHDYGYTTFELSIPIS